MSTPVGGPTVFIVDDDEGVRDSVAALIESYGFATAVFATGTAFLEKVAAGQRGCVLLDVRLPDMTGLTVQTRLRERGITLPVVMITAFADVPLAVAAMRAGAADFLEKPYSDDVLIASVHLALARAETIADIEEQAARTNARLAQLTPRERQVLDFLLVGRQNKQIAHDLGISPRTVEIHRARVMDKMQAGSLSELVRIVLTVRAR